MNVVGFSAQHNGRLHLKEIFLPHENSTLLGYYAARNGQFLTDVSGPPIGSHLQRQRIKKITLEDGTYRLSRNVSNDLPLIVV